MNALSDSNRDLPEAQPILGRLTELARTAALAEMASGLAHELSQPLGAIATYAQAGERLLNLAEPNLPCARNVLQQISSEALNAGEGIRRIRRLFDQGDTRREACRMDELVAELVPTLDALARSAGIRLALDLRAPLPEVCIERLRVQLVIYTLFKNAVDASGDNGGECVALRVSADRYAVETSITDAGVGIAPEVADRLFKPFVTTKPGGTGLGLASSRACIEAHEGTIGCDPALPSGSRFWFRLPVPAP